VVGCSRMAKTTVSPEGTATQGRLTATYFLYTIHVNIKGRAPANADELRMFGEALSTTEGGPLSLTPEVLTSSRDGQAIVVRYGLPLRTTPKPLPGKDNPPAVEGPVLAHEAAGFNGRRFVVYAGTGRIEEVDEAKFKQLVP